MSSWLDKFKADLADIQAKGKATRTKSAFDIAALVSSSDAQSILARDKAESKRQWDSYNPAQKLLYSDGAQKVLDVLARANYASANVADEVINSGIINGEWDIPRMLGSAVEGLEGQSKKTFSDVYGHALKQQEQGKEIPDWFKPGAASAMLAPIAPQAALASVAISPDTPDWLRSVISFESDVIADPTTYIGPGAVKAVGKAAGINKLTGLLPDAVKNRAIDDLATTGTTQTTKTAAEELVEAVSKVAPTPSAEKVAESLNVVEEAAPAVPTPTVTASKLTGELTPQEKLKAMDEAIRGITGKKYSPTELENLRSLFKTTTTKRPTVVDKNGVLEADVLEETLTKKLEAPDLDIWSGKATKALNDPERVRMLQEAETPEAFTAKLDEFLQETHKYDFQSLDELQEAFKSGRIAEDDVKSILKSFGRASSISGAKRVRTKLEQLVAADNVPTAVEQVARSKAGDKQALEMTQVPLTPHEAGVVSRAVAKTLETDFIQPSQFKYTTATGAMRNAPEGAAGRSVYLGLNKPSQYTLHKNLLHEFKVIQPKDLSGAHLAAWKYDNYLPLLKASEDALISKGINPYTGMSGRGIPLSLSDVLYAMPRDFVERHMFNKLVSSKVPMQIPPTNWLDAATELINWHKVGDKTEEALDALRGNIYAALTKGTSEYNTWKKMNEAAFNSKSGKAGKFADIRIGRTIDKFIEQLPRLVDAVEKNSARIGIRYGEYVEALRKETIEPLMADVAASIANPNKIMELVNGIEKSVEQAAKGIGHAPEGAVTQVANEAIAEVAEALPVAEIKAAAKVEKAVLSGTPNATVKMVEVADDAVPEIVGKVADMSEFIEYSWYTQFARAIFPHIANKDLRPLLLEKELSASTFAAEHAKMLSKIDKAYSKSEIQQAFQLVQKGQLEHANPRMQAVIQDINSAVSMVYNTHGTGVISRNGISLEDINTKFASKGVPSRYKFVTDIDYDLGLHSWRNWEDVEDPLNLLSRTYAAVQSAVADRMLADNIKKRFGSVSRTAERNVRLDKLEKTSIAKLIGGETYFAEDIANQIRILETTIKELTKAPSRSKLMKLYDSAVHSYKLGLTSYNPQHHFRNMYGDMWLASMDGLWNPKYYDKSRRVLSTRSHNYKDYNFDIFNIGKIAEDNKSIVTLRHRGKAYNLSADNLYRLAAQKAILTNWSIIEDLGVGASDEILQTSVSDFLKRHSPFKGKIHEGVTSFSEYREHYSRMAHFLYALDTTRLNPKLKFEDALDEAASAAGGRVRKWHPDGSDYSNFEKQALRRTILFYSWVRKAIPLVIESAVTRPGRFMVYPKAMYNMAEANGISLNGYADPFPRDQLFPSWMHDYAMGPHMGQAGGYFGIRPGVPATDVLEQYFTSPLGTLRTVVGGTTPLIRIPAEVASGSSLRTGGAIDKDWADYIIGQLPFAGRANTLAGKPLGSEPPSNVGYEPQLDTPVGTLDERGITALNWLTGLGITDMSKPSYQRSAQLEKRDKAR